MSRKFSVCVCLPVGYNSGGWVTLSKDVNAETKKSIIGLLFCVGVKGSAWN